MKIEKITLYHVELPLRRPFVTSFGSINARGTLLVKLEAGGRAGWGAAAHLPLPVYVPEFLPASKILLAEHILPRVAGREFNRPQDVGQCYSDLKGNNLSKAAVEMAMWDLFAVTEAEPLYKYLGAKRRTVTAGISIGIKSGQQLLEEIAGAVESGYKRIKVKIKPGADIGTVELVRKHFPDVPLMVDANSAYTLADVETFKKLDDYDLMMIEQPLADDDIIDHAKLQQQISTPLCLDESVPSAETARKAAELGSCRIINIKPGRVGGIAESLKILAVCRAHGLSAWIGGMLESGIGKALLAHLAAADGVDLPSDLTPADSYLAEDIVTCPQPVDGVVTLSDEPGIGVKVDEELLGKYLRGKIVLGG